jgi:hypothetical protein
MLSTEMLLAKRCLNGRLGKEAAEWAVSQLELGRDGKFLRQLAGVLGDENPFDHMRTTPWEGTDVQRVGF